MSGLFMARNSRSHLGYELDLELREVIEELLSSTQSTLTGERTQNTSGQNYEKK
jgi:hypothetical protein